MTKYGVDINVLVGKSHMERRFLAFVEDWEEPCIRTKSPKSEILIKRKYANINCYDTDKGMEPRKIDNLRIKWIGRQDYNCYCVLVRKDVEVTDENEDDWEPFPINSDLHFMIRSFYKNNPGETLNSLVHLIVLFFGLCCFLTHQPLTNQQDTRE